VARLIGLDVGTTALKAVAISDDGDVLDRASAGYRLSMPRPGWTEQDPDDWWGAAKAVLSQLGGDRADGIAVSGQMHGLVALDGGGRPLRPAMLWNDGRTADECREIERRIGRERLVELTGNRAATGFTAPKLLWMQRHERELFARIRHVMMPKDYVRYRLTGEIAADVTDASGTLLFDVAGRRWSDEVLTALEVPAAWMPQVHESTARAGSVGSVPVAAGAGDQASGAIGAGVTRTGLASVVLGTSGVVFAPLPAYRFDPPARLHTFCDARPGGWHAMGVMLSAAGSLRWLRDAVAPGTPFDQLSHEAAAWDAGSGGLLFLPYLSGERTPHNDPAARGAFIGLGLEHDRGAMARAVMEGVAYGLRDSLELLAALGDRPSVGRASGGGAASELWLRIVASALELRLERIEVEDGSAYGAALLAGVAAGVFADVADAASRCVRVTTTIDPDDAWTASYRDGYARFTRAYPAVRPL
jgi:xylulokinase